MENIIVRHDDFDFRMEPQSYIDIHEKFIEAGLTETAVLQFTQDGRLKTFKPELIEYMRTAPNWNIQLHGWEHTKYSEMEVDAIVKDMAACAYMCQRLFGKTATTWFPPWNCYSQNMERAMPVLGLKIDNESYDIAKFVREVEAGTYTGHSVYFHGWNGNEMSHFDQMINCLKKLKNAT